MWSHMTMGRNTRFELVTRGLAFHEVTDTTASSNDENIVTEHFTYSTSWVNSGINKHPLSDSNRDAAMNDYYLFSRQAPYQLGLNGYK